MNSSGDGDTRTSPSLPEISGRDRRWLGEWLLRGNVPAPGRHATAPWWQVMCLTGSWWNGVTTQHGSIWTAIGLGFLLFPKLALGLSGFETGVAVMPLMRGSADDPPHHPVARIRNTRKLLTTAALIMSVALIASSLVTTILVPAAEFEIGGKAYGRGLSCLAHDLFGDGFGTGYDVITIGILWFAGASAWRAS